MVAMAVPLMVEQTKVAESKQAEVARVTVGLVSAQASSSYERTPWFGRVGKVGAPDGQDERVPPTQMPAFEIWARATVVQVASEKETEPIMVESAEQYEDDEAGWVPVTVEPRTLQTPILAAPWRATIPVPAAQVVEALPEVVLRYEVAVIQPAGGKAPRGEAGPRAGFTHTYWRPAERMEQPVGIWDTEVAASVVQFKFEYWTM
jgi:hypothetical protein